MALIGATGLIDLGVAGNPSTGDTLRTAFAKVNANFSNIDQRLGGATGFLQGDVGATGLTGATGASASTSNNGATGSGSVTIDNLTFSVSSNRPQVQRSGGSSQTLLGSYISVINGVTASGNVSLSAGFSAANLGSGQFTNNGDTAVYWLINTTTPEMFQVIFTRTSSSNTTIVVQQLI